MGALLDHRVDWCLMGKIKPFGDVVGTFIVQCWFIDEEPLHYSPLTKTRHPPSFPRNPVDSSSEYDMESIYPRGLPTPCQGINLRVQI